MQALLAEPRVVLDTAPLIYFLSGRAGRAAIVRGLLNVAAHGELELVISALTEAELLVVPLRLDDPTSSVRAVENLIVGPPALDVRDVTRAVAREAARIRAKWNLRLADAVIAATAVTSGSKAVLGNDAMFRRVEVDGLRYYHLDDLAPGGVE